MTLETDGFLLAKGVLSRAECAALAVRLDEGGEESRRGEAVFARRNLGRHPAVQAAAALLRERLRLAGSLLLTRAILFDKVPGANWPVPWHQDLSLAVRERAELPGWGPWSVKAGIVHVQPPAARLERLLTLRLHLDDCPEENGALRVLPGTHSLGRLDASAIARLRTEIPERVCAAASGTVLLMRPLLLHASSPAQAPVRRRILHLELAPPDLLPAPLAWN
jgi:ectoine hydroxylase-related dioxygenase (phytanoyl-CoA dioxygenase family)